MRIFRNWPHEELEFIHQLKAKSIHTEDKYTSQEMADAVFDRFERKVTANQVRSRISDTREKYQYIYDAAAGDAVADAAPTAEKPQRNFKATTTTDEHGHIVSEQLVELDKKELHDAESLLIKHGYDPDIFILEKHRASEWQSPTKAGERTLYASRIEVRPRNKQDLNVDAILAKIDAVVTPKHIQAPAVASDNCLVLPLYDLHFGIATLDSYSLLLDNVTELLRERTYEEVVITTGSDMLHHNDHRSRTASGTPIQEVDFNQAVIDAIEFYGVIIETAIENSKAVEVVYVKGNHDETPSQLVTMILERQYPQVSFDTSFDEYKAREFGNNFIGFTHGDKATKKKLPGIFTAEFGVVKGMNRDIIIGHLHHEQTIDDAGFTIRQVSASVPADQWHKDKGYITAHYRNIALVYDTRRLKQAVYI